MTAPGAHRSRNCACRQTLTIHTVGAAEVNTKVTMKKILLRGLSPTTTEEGLRAWLSHYGHVSHVALVRDGDIRKPIAVVEMNIADGLAFFVVSQIHRYWHDGSLVSAYLLLH